MVRDLFENGYNSLEITFARTFFAAVIVGLFFLLYNRSFFSIKKYIRSDWILLFIMGFNSILANVLFNDAIKETSVLNVLMILYLSIFWGFLSGIIFFKEKYNFKKIIYLIFAFIGIMFVLLKSNGEIKLQIGYGELYALIVSLLMVISIVLSKKLYHINSSFRVFASLLVAGVFSFLLIFINNPNIEYLSRFLDKDFILMGGLLALTAGIMAKGFKELGTNYVPASVVLVIMLCEPIFQMYTAYLFAGETLSPINLIGVLIVFTMIILISKKDTKFNEI